MKIKKADIIVTLGLFFISLGINFIINKANQKYDGDILVVEQDGKVIERLPLEEDNTYVARYGGHYTKIVIKDKKAMIVEADCLDQICTHMHPIDKEGESIICLPHKLFLQVESGENKKKNKVEDKIDKVVR